MQNTLPVSNPQFPFSDYFINGIKERVFTTLDHEYSTETELINSDTTMSTSEKIHAHRNSLLFYVAGIGTVAYILYKVTPYLK